MERSPYSTLHDFDRVIVSASILRQTFGCMDCREAKVIAITNDEIVCEVYVDLLRTMRFDRKTGRNEFSRLLTYPYEGSLWYIHPHLIKGKPKIVNVKWVGA